jgi:predicted lipoprotein with Yx(FWY)xxD motif
MTGRSHRLIASLSATGLAVLAAVAAGCGGSGSGATAATSSAPKTAGGQAATVGLANTGLGEILVDSQGRTLYLFKADHGTKSACTGACAAAWPPLLAKAKPTVGSGANASLLGTSPRPEGTMQVTYNGHPLYLFVKDGKAGETNGQGVTAFGAAWFALNAGGNQASGTSSGSGTSGSGSLGY